MKDSEGIRLNLGCGHIQPEGWVNIDASNRAKFAHYLPWLDRALVRWGVLAPTEFSAKTQIVNLSKKLPYRSHSVEAIYCGELLEHFTRGDVDKVLAECVRVLRPGGCFRCCVPDVHAFWKKYCHQVDKMLQSSRTQWDDRELRRLVGAFFADICVEKPRLGSMGHYHKWGYDEIQMVLALQQAGLVNVSRRQRLDSAIRGIEAVETRQSEFLIVEGTKPHSPQSSDCPGDESRDSRETSTSW